MLDERLSLAFSLYPPCTVAADIGTDHALLPCALIQQGRCQRMILSDISAKALQHAREQVAIQHLGSQTTLVVADGLDGVTEKCDCISIMGMGGETLCGILQRGQDRLQGAVLVLSAHTDLPQVRKTIQSIGYHVVREEVCQAAGRFYLMWRAEVGEQPLTEADSRRGTLLWQSKSPLLPAYIAWRVKVLQAKLTGLLQAEKQDEKLIAQTRDDLAFYHQQAQEVLE